MERIAGYFVGFHSRKALRLGDLGWCNQGGNTVAIFRRSNEASDARKTVMPPGPLATSRGAGGGVCGRL
jgi:hypothetical protein